MLFLIKQEILLLYDRGEFILSEAKDLPWSEEIAKDCYEK
ncbi:hypothetical protein A1E_00645 [Rickettsia canadensis str. McKiel]|uniref:Uncharacterized protein n=1 Tax=Rickettsia canadensis (strain McKiel) TaxID=293613 RepID=A8EXJ4_RICCK|nr:hypothetical protein A1E_00645 [Rickettsia canadensis str. McKiel]